MKVRAVYNFIGKVTSKNQISISQKAHFKNRYFERTGVRCIEPIYQDIMSRLKSGKLKCKGFNKDRKTYEFELEKHVYTIVYDYKTATLVTIF